MKNWQKFGIMAVLAIVAMYILTECAPKAASGSDFTQTLESGTIVVEAPSHHQWLTNAEELTLLSGGPVSYTWEGSYPTDANRVWGNGEGTLENGQKLIIELPPPSEWPQGSEEDFYVYETHIVVHLTATDGSYLGVSWDVWFKTQPSPTPTRTATPTMATNTPTGTPSPTRTSTLTPTSTSTRTPTPADEPQEFKYFLSWMSVEIPPPATSTPTATRTPRPRKSPTPEPSATATPVPPTETPSRPTEQVPTATRPPA